MQPNLQYSGLQTSLSDFQVPLTSNDDTIDVFLPASQQSLLNTAPRFPIYPNEDSILIELLGKVGNGLVYKAYHKPSNRLVALKKIPLQDGNYSILSNNQRISVESSIIQKLSLEKSEYFLEYYGVYQDNLDICIEMQPGIVTLNELIESGRVFSRKEILYILSRIVNAMIFLESKGIVNRDIKPSNILLVPTDESPHIFEYKLYDFGIGYLYAPNERYRKIHKNTLLGYTPEFTAPELGRIIGNHDLVTEYYDPYSADVYSLGLTGLKLLGGQYREFHDRNLKEFIESNGELGYVLACMLIPEPEERIKLTKLKELLDEFILRLAILPPKIEKVSMKKALTNRFYKQHKGDYKLVIFEFLDCLRKYFEFGKPVEFERYLELTLFELVKEDSMLRFSHEEVKILEVVGAYYQRNSQFAHAEKAFKEAYEMAKVLLWGRNEGFVSEAADFLGCFYARRHKFDEAEKHLIEAYKINQEFFGEDHLFTANSMRSLGELYLKKQDYAKALDLLTTALKKISGILYSEEKPSNYQILLGLMNLLTVEEINHITGLKALEEVHGNGTGAPLVSLEELDMRVGNLTNEEEFYRKAYRSKKKAWTIVHAIINRDLAIAMGSFGRLNLALGDYKKAQKLFRKNLNIMIGVYGECNWEVARIYEDLRSVYEKVNNLKKAERMGLRVVEIRMRIGGKSMEVMESMRDMERIYDKLGEEERKKSFRRRREELLKKVSGGDEKHEKEIREILDVGERIV